MGFGNPIVETIAPRLMVALVNTSRVCYVSPTTGYSTFTYPETLTNIPIFIGIGPYWGGCVGNGDFYNFEIGSVSLTQYRLYITAANGDGVTRSFKVYTFWEVWP